MKRLKSIAFKIVLLGYVVFNFNCEDKNNTTLAVTNIAKSTKQHPNLILTQEGVKAIQANLGQIPLFDKSLAETKALVDTEIASGIHVPIPKDFSGGYTHEKHKRNFMMMQKAGVLFQILNDQTYAVYVRDMLLAYAELYPKLPVHPQTRSYARGKIFWQCLNDSNWLVYTSQAYDCVYDWLSEDERNHLEKDLFVPFANFISEENPQFFNRVHNHSTWGNVAVGMIALVMDNDELLEKALHGLKTDNIDANMKDNDGGYIKTKGQKVGFYANLEEPFSPDGYYTEGPYYQRYAMYPFLIFAEALQNKKPELKIFEFKDGVLLNAVDALLNLTDADGEFFPINDGQKGMSYHSRELITAVDIAYHFGDNSPELLSIVEQQGKVALDPTGLSVALAVKEGKASPFVKSSLQLHDGPDGDQGGVGILRANDLELVYKYTSQGLSHGHYDKLSYSLYESGDEVVQDYGLTRFVNIEQKGGGNYLKENKTWSKQTVAHNTLVQDESSHFGGSYDVGSQHHSDAYIFKVDDVNLQVVSAKEVNAYPGTEMQRSMVFIKNENLEKPFLLDIMRVTSTKAHQYDLPLYYMGQLMQTSFTYKAESTLSPLGKNNGYQHLYKEAAAVSNGDNTKLSWLLNNKFYTATSVTSVNDEMLLVRTGATDPEFNIRREPGLILRKKKSKNALFVTVIESHGSYSPVSELAVDAYSHILNISVIYDTEAYTAIEIKDDLDKIYTFIIANNDNSKTKSHILEVNNKVFNWNGPYLLK